MDWYNETMKHFTTNASPGTIVFEVIFAILLIIALWRIFEKASVPGWMSIVPFVNAYQEFKITWGNGWLFLLMFIPIVNIVIEIITMVKLSKAFGHGGGYACGLIFLPTIFFLILGFDDSRYIGPQ